MQRTSISIFLILGLVFATGCQEGKRKDQENKVHASGVADLDQMADQLNSLGLSLDEDFKENPTDEVLSLPEQVRASNKISDVQDLLERYSIKATKLLGIGDTDVVEFPEKNRIQKYRARAYEYLGQIYAQQDLFSKRMSVENRQVSHSEYVHRFKAFQNTLILFDKFGFTTDVLVKGDQAEWAAIAHKISTKDLNAGIKAGEVFGNNIARMAELTEKNNGFGLEGLGELGKTLESIGAFYYDVLILLKAEFAKR